MNSSKSSRITSKNAKGSKRKQERKTKPPKNGSKIKKADDEMEHVNGMRAEHWARDKLFSLQIQELEHKANLAQIKFEEKRILW